jgi:hypothetical protein
MHLKAIVPELEFLNGGWPGIAPGGSDTEWLGKGSAVPARIPKALINSNEHPSGRCIMRNHDIVSNGFLALTTASLVLLCSSLLAAAFG